MLVRLLPGRHHALDTLATEFNLVKETPDLVGVGFVLDATVGAADDPFKDCKFL